MLKYSRQKSYAIEQLAIGCNIFSLVFYKIWDLFFFLSVNDWH